MKILQANKFYYLRSGAERYLFNLTRLLEQKGHQVIPFAVHHPSNQPTPYSRHFLRGLDFHSLGPAQAGLALRRIIYDREAARRIDGLLDETRPDLAVVHNIYHHISPSILPGIAVRGIPILHRLHDYQRICPSYLLLSKGRICERCRGHRYYHALLQRCLHGSLSWSLLAGAASAIHHRLRSYEAYVNRSIVSGPFMQRKMMEFGMAPAQLAILPYFLFPEDYEPEYQPGREIVYVGRLSHEKGLPTLLRAMKLLPALPLRVIGEGPLLPQLQRQAADDGLGNVVFSGYLSGEGLKAAIRGASLAVVPSEWYEVFGQSAIEALALGKPVIAARTGGLAEVVEDGVDGRLFTPGNAHELAEVIAGAVAHPARLVEMGKAGRRKVELKYGPEFHYQELMSIYRSL